MWRNSQQDSDLGHEEKRDDCVYGVLGGREGRKAVRVQGKLGKK